MDLADHLRKAVDIVKLNGAVMVEVGADQKSLLPGLVIVTVGGLAPWVWAFFLHTDIRSLIELHLCPLIGAFFGLGVLHLVATKIYGGKGNFMSLLRAESHAAIIGWAWIVPPAGVVVGFWHLPMTVVILQSLYGMPRGKAIRTVVTALLLGLGALMCLGYLAVSGLLGSRR